MKLVSENISTTQSQVAKQISQSNNNNNYIQAVVGDSYEKQAINNIFDSLMLNTPQKMWTSDPTYTDPGTEVSLTKKTFAFRTYLSWQKWCFSLCWFIYRYKTNNFKYLELMKWTSCFFSFTHTAHRLQQSVCGPPKSWLFRLILELSSWEVQVSHNNTSTCQSSRLKPSANC